MLHGAWFHGTRNPKSIGSWAWTYPAPPHTYMPLRWHPPRALQQLLGGGALKPQGASDPSPQRSACPPCNPPRSSLGPLLQAEGQAAARERAFSELAPRLGSPLPQRRPDLEPSWPAFRCQVSLCQRAPNPSSLVLTASFTAGSDVLRESKVRVFLHHHHHVSGLRMSR